VQEVRAWYDEVMRVPDCEPPTTYPGDRAANPGPAEPDCEPPTTSPAAPVYRRVSFRVPSFVAVYIEETLDLAQSLLGRDAGEDQQLTAVVAEAGTEIETSVSPADALARLGLPSLHELHESRPEATQPTGSRESSRTRLRSARPRHRADRVASNRRAALVLDRYLQRQTRRLRETDVTLEDELLNALESYSAHRCGFASFTDFAREVMDLAPRTTWDWIRRARLRRSEDPIAVARARGRITVVKADLLQRLWRLQVPYAQMECWIRYAETITTRRLRQSVAWARIQTFQGNDAWRRQGSPPPSDSQLRTSNRPLDEIAADCSLPDLESARAAPQVSVHWSLEAETLIDLAQLMTSLAEAHWRRTCKLAPAWWSLLVVFWHARQAWAPLVEGNQTTRQRRRILERDRYRCVFPDCSLRQGVEVHHIVYRGQQGKDEDQNLVALCGFHHRLGEHEHTVRVRGRATEGGDSLRWEMGIDLQGRPRLIYLGERLMTDGRRDSRSDNP
jgi:hypothetical protein